MIKSDKRNVLLVGGAGYLGSVLATKLLSEGFSVRILDICMYGKNHMSKILNNKRIELIIGDIRNMQMLIHVLEDIDSVINLAAIVGDPACKDRPGETIAINYVANKALAEACKYKKIQRFIFASTCSVYGFMKNENELKEDSPLNPISLYSQTKVQSEQAIIALMDKNFSPTILRLSTLYGYSPRMRFDLVVNTMVKNALQSKKIFVHGNGQQWRPLLYIDDAADAFIACLSAPIKKIKGKIFNVGSEIQNFKIIDIAERVKKNIPDAQIIFEEKNTDLRNYFVSFKKIQKTLNYRVRESLDEAIKKIIKEIKSGNLKNLDNSRYYNDKYAF